MFVYINFACVLSITKLIGYQSKLCDYNNRVRMFMLCMFYVLWYLSVIRPPTYSYIVPIYVIYVPIFPYMFLYMFLYRNIYNIYEHICWGSDNRQVPAAVTQLIANWCCGARSIIRIADHQHHVSGTNFLPNRHFNQTIFNRPIAGQVRVFGLFSNQSQKSEN